MSTIIPKLGLFNIKDSALGEYAQDKIDKINAAPAFAAVINLVCVPLNLL